MRFVGNKPRTTLRSDGAQHSSNATAIKVVHAAFEGLAPILADYGITSPQAEALLRAVCVHAVARAQTAEGRRLNISRVSVKTGVDRHSVAAILKDPPGSNVTLGSRRDSISRVIDGWLSDPEYTDRGCPLDLEIGGPGVKRRSVWTLAQRYAPGVWPRLIVDELIRVDYVETLPTGRLRWKGTPGTGLSSRVLNEESASQRLHDAVRALVRDATQSEGRRAWRTAQSLDITEQDLPLVRKMLRDRLSSMFAWITDELNSARWRRDDSGAGIRIRVGVSGFTYEEPLPKGADHEDAKRAAGSKP